MFDFSLIKKSLNSLTSEHSKLQKQLEALRQERDVVAAAPVAPAEFLESMGQYIDQASTEFEGGLANVLRHFTHEHGRAAAGHHPAMLNTDRVGFINGTAVNREAALYFFGAAIKDGLARFAASDAYPQGGLTTTERTKQLAALDSKIADIEGKLATLTAEAKAAGVAL